MAHGVAQQSVACALSDRAYSFALRSVSETKDTLILVCVGLLEALDRLQERLHLPTSIVKELKRRLTKMVDRSSASGTTKFPSARTLGDTVAESEVWDVAQPEEVHGVVHWVLAVLKSLQRLAVSVSLGVCHGIYILIMSLPGVSTACSLFYGLLHAVEDTLRLSSEEIMEAASSAGVGSFVGSGPGSGRSRGHHLHHRHHRNAESYVDDPSLTAVVLEYKEKECMVPSNIDRRIRRVMHFQIPLRSFEATVRLPPGHDEAQAQAQAASTCWGGAMSAQGRSQEEGTSMYAHLSSASPRSIPVSPLARRRVQLAFSNFSDDVLYQARDRLRQERAATLMGDRDLRVPRFNPQDCHKDIYLSCGRHCASKVGAGMYRSVRASVPLQKSRFVYFEMTLQEGRSPLRGTNQSANKLDVPVRAGAGAGALKTGGATTATGASETRAGADASVCIGLSTRLMPLNTLVGTSPNSIGFYSAGHVLVGSGPRSSVGVGQKYGYQSTVGVLAQVVDRQDNGEEAGASSGNAPPLSSSTSAPGSSIGEAFVRFTVDGTALRDSENRVMEFSLPFPSRGELYPTLTLHSQDVQVFSRFSAPDVVGLNLQELELPVEEPVEIWCLDGLCLGIST